jgi:hypothetical protein
MNRQGPAVTLVVAPVAPRATLFSSPTQNPEGKAPGRSTKAGRGTAMSALLEY